jgi:hypothetical protein
VIAIATLDVDALGARSWQGGLSLLDRDDPQVKVEHEVLGGYRRRGHETSSREHSMTGPRSQAGTAACTTPLAH